MSDSSEILFWIFGIVEGWKNTNLHIYQIIRQEAFMENYFSSQRDHIFRNVEVLIYIFDIESKELQVPLLFK